MDFVTQSSSFHEFHGFGCTRHISLGLGDEFVKIGSRHGLNDGIVGSQWLLVGFRGVMFGSIRDGIALFKESALLLFDLLRRKSVRFIVRDLFGTAPRRFLDGL